MIATFV